MTAHNVEGDFDTLKEDLAKLRDDIASLSNTLRDVTSETVHEQIDSIRGRINRLSDEAKLEGRERLDRVTDYIEERPLTSILIAFGVGVLLGKLFDR